MAGRGPLGLLLESFVIHLRAGNKSAATVATYRSGVRVFLAWQGHRGDDVALDRATVTAWLAAMLEAGASPATARTRLSAVRMFSKWLADEGEIEADQLNGLHLPQLMAPAVMPLSGADLRALITACRKGRAFADRRDEAVIRMLAETGIRAGELLAMTTDVVDIHTGLALIVRGKGGRGRRVPFGPQTAAAVDSYLRQRRHHRLAHEPALWLGAGGKRFSYYALRRMLLRRGDQAGVANIHPHRFRHTTAHRWLEAGGSETGLMALAGWQRPDQLVRYTRAKAEARTAEEARKLRLGDL